MNGQMNNFDISFFEGIGDMPRVKITADICFTDLHGISNIDLQSLKQSILDAVIDATELDEEDVNELPKNQ